MKKWVKAEDDAFFAQYTLHEFRKQYETLLMKYSQLVIIMQNGRIIPKDKQKAKTVNEAIKTWKILNSM